MIKDNQSISAIKVWIFPTLVSLISLLIWNDVNEIKADVKLLMAQSNIDKTRIDNLERQMFKSASLPVLPVEKDLDYQWSVAILRDNKYKTIKYEF